MEFGRRIAAERELEKHGSLRHENTIFDESGNFLLYPTLLGIKVVNIVTNNLCRVIGKVWLRESYCCVADRRAGRKPAHHAHCAAAVQAAQARRRRHDDPDGGGRQSHVRCLSRAVLPTEMAHCRLRQNEADPTLFATAYKRNRFFLFTQREAQEIGGEVGGAYSRQQLQCRACRLAATCSTRSPARRSKCRRPGADWRAIALAHAERSNSALANQRLAEFAIIHTTLGDIHVKLQPKEVCADERWHKISLRSPRPPRRSRISPCTAATATTTGC